MISLRPLTREEMLKNWARVQAPKPKPEPEPRPLNLQHILDLGNTVYFTFRGRAYGIPPLAWRTGERILDTWLELAEIGESVNRKNLPNYFRLIRRLQRVLWRACRPVGPFRRLIRRFDLHPNPFRKATEAELIELALFTLGRRTSPGALHPMGNGNRGT